MAASLYLVIVIAAFALAEEPAVIDTVAAGTSTLDNTPPSGVQGGLIDMQKAIAGDLDFKMLMTNDGSPTGKCYCSCNLNNRPVFLEIDSANMPGTYAIE